MDRKSDRTGFSCGTPELDSYFHRQVGQEVDRGFAACFTTLDNEGIIVGYYTLSALSVSVELVPEGLRKKLPRYDQIPCALLGRLAVAANLKKQGIGRIMLIHALRAAEGADVASYALVADAKDGQALDYYVHHGFTAWDADKPMRCFIPLRAGSVPAATPKPPVKAPAAAKTALPMPTAPQESEEPEAAPPSSPRPAVKRIR